MAKAVKERLDNAPMFTSRLQQGEDLKGSNAWLVAGYHTESGYPLIANDPHLTMDTPAIWYENHLVFGDDWHVNGTSVVLGCSSHACW